MGLCYGHASEIVVKDVCSTVLEGAGFDAAVAWELCLRIRIFGGIGVGV